MADDNSPSKDWHDGKKGKKDYSSSGMLGFGYFVVFIAAAVYFIQQATSFGMGVIGFLKALVWPGFLVYHLMDFLNM